MHGSSNKKIKIKLTGGTFSHNGETFLAKNDVNKMMFKNYVQKMMFKIRHVQTNNCDHDK